MRFPAFLLLSVVTGCQCGRAGPTRCEEGAALSVASQQARAEGHQLDVTMDRDGDCTRVVVDAHITRDDGTGVDGLGVDISSTRGDVSVVESRGEGHYRAVVTPDADHTGEYPINVRVDAPALSVKRTAVVLDDVGAEWGQPMMVEGLVNTCGWEDSLAVSPDGQWLYLEYTPVSISCYLGLNRFASACREAEGPWKAPQRPGMFNADRIDDDGNVKHGCPITGIDPTPVPLAPIAVFGFKRQPDGSFSEPFAVGYEHQCNSFFGPSIRVNSNGTHTMLYAWTDTAEDGADNDLYTVDFTPGARVVLGDYERVDGKATLKDARHKRLGLPLKGNQGNPHLQFADDGRVLNIFHDDESEQNQELYVLSVDGSYPDGPFGQKQKLPGSINTKEGAEVQPFFDGETLLFRRENAIVQFHFKGGALTDDAAWEPRGNAVAVGDASAFASGVVVTVGEPTIARVENHRELYFVYALRRDNGTIDINAAVVRSR